MSYTPILVITIVLIHLAAYVVMQMVDRL